ncbi:hypothetical protein MARINON1_50307 [Marinobacter salarius]|nr:hypothetical protein MBHK15_120308 [Marinobacter salarius]VXB39400.1 hypothetical protein MARINON1_50307 [Marinobacter salarius]
MWRPSKAPSTLCRSDSAGGGDKGGIARIEMHPSLDQNIPIIGTSEVSRCKRIPASL